MKKAFITEYSFDDYRNVKNFEVNEIIPSNLLILSSSTNNDKIYVIRMMVPINGKGTLVFADPAKGLSFDNLKNELNTTFGEKSINDLFDLSGFDLSGYSLQFPSLEGLSAATLTEKFQELQKSIKEHLENISPFKK